MIDIYANPAEFCLNPYLTIPFWIGKLYISGEVIHLRMHEQKRLDDSLKLARVIWA
ncbi:hypothetical protein [Crinalium epipsammum]|nr:hypothetical protein [Crinalium epipsammum]